MSPPRTAPPITVRLATLRNAARVLAGAVICLVLGAAVLTAGLRGPPGTTPTVLALVVAAVLAGLGVAIIASWWVGRRTRAVVFDADGIHWDSANRPWQVGWPELARASVHVSHQARRSRGSMSAHTLWRVTLQLEPADDGFGARHPELDRLRSGDATYRVRFGPRRELVAPLELGLQAFAGPRNGGVVDDGRLSWEPPS